MAVSGVTVPPEIAGQGARHNLGAYRARYVITRPSLGGRVAMGTAIAVVLVGAVGGGWPGVGITAGLGVLVYAALRYVNRRAARDRMRFYLFERGFVQEAPATGQVEVYPWVGIDAVFQKVAERHSVGSPGLPPRITYLYRVRRSDGVSTDFGVRVDSAGVTPEIAVFGRTVLQEVSRLKLPAAQAAVARGETVDFGDLGMSQSELLGRARGWTLPWEQVAQVRVRAGTVEVLRHGMRLPYMSITADGVPNLPAFLTLADQLRQSTQPGTR